MTRTQISNLQRAVWKLQSAKEGVIAALNDTDVGVDYATRIDDLIEDMESDLAENTPFID